MSKTLRSTVKADLHFYRALDHEAHNNTTILKSRYFHIVFFKSYYLYMTLEKRNQRFTVTFTTNIRSTQGHKNNRFWHLKFLKILSQSLNLFNEEVNVFKGSSWVGDDHTEEVDLVSLRLIAHHGRPVLHHSGFDYRGNL